MFRRKDISELTDEEILYQYEVSGDPTWFGELYTRYLPLLYGVCLKYLKDADKARDATMQLFEDLLPRISRYQIKVFRTWIYSVAKNHCLQILRKDKEPINIVGLETGFMESDEILHLLEEEPSDEERMEALRHCLEKLPEKQKVSVVCFFMDSMSYADIVDHTGYRLKEVKSYIQNGKRNLKICIEKSQ